VASLPVADPLWRNVDERLVGSEGEPTRRQWPDAFVQDAYKDVFRYEGAASIMSQPAHVPRNDAHEHLQGSRHPLCCPRRTMGGPRVAALLALCIFYLS
jgi:hypothetical protein